MTLDLLLTGGRVVTCEGDAPLTAHAIDVGIAGGRIAHLGEGAPPAREVLDVSGLLLLPGLVDPHTHLVFAGSRVDEFARRMAGASYGEIAAEGGGIAATVRRTREASDDELWALAKARVEALRVHGVTSVEIKSGYGLSTEHELRLLRVARRVAQEGLARVRTTFLGAHALPPERRDDRERYVEEVVQEQLPAVAESGLADACDVYCDEGAFTLAEARRVLERAHALGLAVRAHVGQFADLGGAELAAELGALSADHLEEVSDRGLEALARAGTVAVLLPGAWRTLRQAAPRAERFRAAGVSVAVGTDLNPGTSPTTDLPLMASLAVRDAGLTTEEAVLAITRNAARAAGFDAGTLRLGGPADIAAFALSDARALPYAFGGLQASLVLLAGRVLMRREAPRIW